MYIYNFLKISSYFAILKRLENYRCLPFYIYGCTEFLSFLMQFNLFLSPIKMISNKEKMIFQISDIFLFQFHLKNDRLYITIKGNKEYKDEIINMAYFFQPHYYFPCYSEKDFYAILEVPIIF